MPSLGLRRRSRFYRSIRGPTEEVVAAWRLVGWESIVVFCIGAQGNKLYEYGFHITAFPEWLLISSPLLVIVAWIASFWIAWKGRVARYDGVRRTLTFAALGVALATAGVALSRSHLPDPDTYWTSLSDAGTLGVDRPIALPSGRTIALAPDSCNPSCVGMSNPTWFGCSTRRGTLRLRSLEPGRSLARWSVCATSRVRSRHL